MVDLKPDFTWVPINTPDAEFRLQSALGLLAEIVLDNVVEAAELDSRETPEVDLPLVSDSVPSQLENSRTLEA